MHLVLKQTAWECHRMQEGDQNYQNCNVRFITGMNFYGQLTLLPSHIAMSFSKQQTSSSCLHLQRQLTAQNLPRFAQSLLELANVLSENCFLIINSFHELQISIYDAHLKRHLEYQIPLIVKKIYQRLNDQRPFVHDIRLYNNKKQQQRREYQRRVNMLKLQCQTSERNRSSFRIERGKVTHLRREKFSFLIGQQLLDINGFYYVRIKLIQVRRKLIFLGVVSFDPSSLYDQSCQRYFLLSLNLQQERTTNRADFSLTQDQLESYLAHFHLQQTERIDPFEIQNSEYHGNFLTFRNYRINTWKKRSFLQLAAFAEEPTANSHKLKDCRLKDGRLREGRVKEGRVKEGRVKEGRLKEGRVKEGSVKEGRIKEEKVKEIRVDVRAKESRAKLVYEMCVNRLENSVRWSKGGEFILEEPLPIRLQKMPFYWMIAMYDQNDTLQFIQ